MHPDNKDMVLLEAARPLTDPTVYAEAIGHSGFQIENFILNNHDFPTPDLKHKQCILELWARYNSYNSSKHQADTLEQEIVILKAERDGDEKALTAAKKKLKDIEIAYKEGCLAIARLDMEHRTLREARVFMELLKQNPASPKPRNEAERENWEAKAANDKKVEAIMNRIRGSEMLTHSKEK